MQRHQPATTSVPTDTSEQEVARQLMRASFSSASGWRLPRLVLTVFKEDLSHWLTLWEQYEAMIHSDASIIVDRGKLSLRSEVSRRRTSNSRSANDGSVLLQCGGESEATVLRQTEDRTATSLGYKVPSPHEIGYGYQRLTETL